MGLSPTGFKQFENFAHFCTKLAFPKIYISHRTSLIYVVADLNLLSTDAAAKELVVPLLIFWVLLLCHDLMILQTGMEGVLDLGFCLQ